MSVSYWLDISPALVTDWSTSAYKGRMAYIRCAQDVVIPVADQDSMLQKSGSDWITHTMEAGHSPFLSCPAALTQLKVNVGKSICCLILVILLLLLLQKGHVEDIY